MFRKLRDVPECLGNINGVDYEADIEVRVTTKPKLRQNVINLKLDAISMDKHYHVHKITSFGDPFDVWVINDKGEEEELADWIFEDVD